MSSYVTRRLLRSTLPGPKDAEEKPQAAESKTKADCGSRTRDDRRKKARRDAAKAREAGSEPEAPPRSEEGGDSGASALHGFELMIDVNYAKDLWAQARVLDLDADKQEVFVHYMGWNARYDAWVGPKLVAPHGSRTKCTTKKKTSWDGKRSLFAPVGGSTPRKAEGSSKHRSHRRSATPNAKNDKRKRRGSASSAASDGKRDGLTPASPTSKRENEDDVMEKEEGDPVADSASRVTRARASKASTSSSEQGIEVANAQSRASPSSKSVAAPEEEADEDSVCKGEEMPIGDAAPTTNGGTGRVLRRQAAGKRRGRGRKGQEDETSESEYSNHEDSDAEEEDDASDEEEVRRLRKRRKQMELGLPVDDEDEDEDEEASDGAAKRKRPTARQSERRAGRTKTHPLPHSAPRVSVASLGDGGATREHLAAIFRQRVFQQQLMQVTRAEMELQQPPSDTAAAPVAPTPAAAAAAASTTRTRSRRGGSQSGNKTKAAATVAAPTAVPDPQLAAYYHYHNMLVAQAYMSADPKEIQERMRAIEQQRVLQLQAYYRHLEAARAQNVQSVEDTQEFMSKSASAWQQQSQASKPKDEKSANEDSTGLEDGTSTSESLENGKAAATGSDSPRDATVQQLVDASGAVKTCKKEGTGTCQADAELKGEPDAPRGDILYEFVL